jgi:hypothetical protein
MKSRLSLWLRPKLLGSSPFTLSAFMSLASMTSASRAISKKSFNRLASRCGTSVQVSYSVSARFNLFSQDVAGWHLVLLLIFQLWYDTLHWLQRPSDHNWCGRTSMCSFAAMHCFAILRPSALWDDEYRHSVTLNLAQQQEAVYCGSLGHSIERCRDEVRLQETRAMNK